MSPKSLYPDHQWHWTYQCALSVSVGDKSVGFFRAVTDTAHPYLQNARRWSFSAGKNQHFDSRWSNESLQSRCLGALVINILIYANGGSRKISEGSIHGQKPVLRHIQGNVTSFLTLFAEKKWKIKSPGMAVTESPTAGSATDLRWETKKGNWFAKNGQNHGRIAENQEKRKRYLLTCAITEKKEQKAKTNI